MSLKRILKYVSSSSMSSPLQSLENCYKSKNKSYLGCLPKELLLELRNFLYPTLWENLHSKIELEACWEAHGGEKIGCVTVFDRSYIVTGGVDCKVKVWNIHDKSLCWEFKHKGNVIALAALPQKHLLASGGFFEEIQLWDLSTGANVRTQRYVPDAAGTWVGALEFKGELLIALINSRFFAWTIATGDMVFSARDVHVSPGRCFTFSSDGYFITGGFDRTLKVWDITSTERPLQEFSLPSEAFCMCARGTEIYTGGAGGKLYHYSTAAPTTEPKILLTLPVESNGAGRCMGIVPVGDSSVAVGDSEGHILFVDVKQAKVYRNVYDPGKRTENMQRPAIVDDVLVGASVDGYIRVWRLR